MNILTLLLIKLIIISGIWAVGSVVYFMNIGAPPNPINMLITLGPLLVSAGVPITIAIIYFLFFVWKIE